MPYQVIDKKDGTIMGTYGTRKGADRKADQLDNEYGGYRYKVQLKKAQAKPKNNNAKLKIA